MAGLEKANEASMDEVLASIRRLLAEDPGASTAPGAFAPPPPAGARNGGAMGHGAFTATPSAPAARSSAPIPAPTPPAARQSAAMPAPAPVSAARKPDVLNIDDVLGLADDDASIQRPPAKPSAPAPAAPAHASAALGRTAHAPAPAAPSGATSPASAVPPSWQFPKAAADNGAEPPFNGGHAHPAPDKSVNAIAPSSPAIAPAPTASAPATSTPSPRAQAAADFGAIVPSRSEASGPSRDTLSSRPPQPVAPLAPEPRLDARPKAEPTFHAPPFPERTLSTPAPKSSANGVGGPAEHALPSLAQRLNGHGSNGQGLNGQGLNGQSLSPQSLAPAEPVKAEPHRAIEVAPVQIPAVPATPVAAPHKSNAANPAVVAAKPAAQKAQNDAAASIAKAVNGAAGPVPRAPAVAATVAATTTPATAKPAPTIVVPVAAKSAAEQAKVDIPAKPAVSPAAQAPSEQPVAPQPVPQSAFIPVTPTVLVSADASKEIAAAIVATPAPAQQAAKPKVGLAATEGHAAVEAEPSRSLEDTVAELLRPMLCQWLDTNMPRIVEKALRVELAASAKSKLDRPKD